MQERRGQTTTAAGRGGDVVDPYRSKLNNNNYYYYNIISPCVFDALLGVLVSAPHQHNERRPLAHSSCRPPRRRSPTPPIVTSYSAPRQHASSAVSLPVDRAHRARHLRAVTTGSRCTRHPASLPPLRSARPGKRPDRRGREARQRGGRGGGGPCLKIKVN